MDNQPSPNPPVGGRRPQAHVLADYSGRGAARVADELRRIGLRPGVQRVDARTPEEVGAILAQDPPAGAAAARNSVITLYVGAALHDRALAEPPADPRSPDTATLARSRRRRKPGHAHALTATPGGAVHAEADAEPMADGIYQDGEGGAHRPGPLEAANEDCVRDEDLAAAGQRVHRDTPPPTVSTPVDESGPASALDARALLTPLSGLPRPLTLKRWQRMTRRARLAITSGLICVAALLALALTDHHEPSPPHPATASRQAARPTLRLPIGGARSSARPRHQYSRTPTASATRHASRTAGAARPPLTSTPAPAPAPEPSPTVTSPAPPAVPAPVAPAVQSTATAIAEPTAASPAVPIAAPGVDGQIPGGPFSP